MRSKILFEPTNVCRKFDSFIVRYLKEIISHRSMYFFIWQMPCFLPSCGLSDWSIEDVTFPFYILFVSSSKLVANWQSRNHFVFFCQQDGIVKAFRFWNSKFFVSHHVEAFNSTLLSKIGRVSFIIIDPLPESLKCSLFIHHYSCLKWYG